MTKLRVFLADDSGVATVDWVALSAGVLLLGIVVVYAIFNNGVSTLVSSVNSFDPGFGNTAALFHVDNMNPPG